ncbi:MAG: M48 family metallopeptidase [Verrucomicrobiae bacterium]|nr:M48 family metallopeptidase [Verrucomicrobiae bacterium]
MKYIPKPLVETADISRGKTSLKSFLQSAVSVVLVLAALYFVLGLLGELLARTLPDRWERKLSRALPIASPSGTNDLQHVQTILAKLTADSSLRQLDYQLFLLELDAPNAVAVPGGGIGLTPELLASVRSETGLAFVIAHELGHHQHRHILRGLGRRLILGLAAALLFNYDGLSSVDAAFRLAETGYSRRQERAADEFALRLVHEKYGDLREALEFFEYLQQTNGDPLWQKYAGSHPLTAERLKHLREFGQQLETRAR